MSIYDSHSEEIERLNALLHSEDDRVARMDAVEEAIRIAESIVEQHPTDAGAHYILGLAWYNYPGSSSHRSWRCRRALERAVEIDPSSQFARHYLACLAFDQERFHDALEIAEGSDFGYFIDLDQEWRALKSEEMKLVCKLRISPDDFPQSDFDLFTQRFEDATQREEKDFTLGSWVHPQELREHAEWMIDTGVPLEDPRVVKLVEFISRIGYAHAFWDSRLKQPQEEQPDGAE